MIPARCTAVVSVLIMAAFGCGNGSSRDTRAVDIPVEQASTTISVDETESGDPGAESAGGVSDLGEFSPFEDGTYTMFELGLPITFTVSEAWTTQPVGDGYFVISWPGGTGPGDHDVVFMRPSLLVDPATRAPDLSVDDFGAWIVRVPSTISLSDPESTQIGGVDAVTFRLQVGDDADCTILDDLSCLDLLVVGNVFAKTFDRGFVYEIAWIDHIDGPIAIVSATTADDPSWLDVARDVVATVEIG